MNEKYYIPKQGICTDMQESSGYIDYAIHDEDGRGLGGGQLNMDENIREVIYFVPGQYLTYVEMRENI